MSSPQTTDKSACGHKNVELEGVEAESGNDYARGHNNVEMDEGEVIVDSESEMKVGEGEEEAGNETNDYACGHKNDFVDEALEVVQLANPSDPLGLATVEPTDPEEVIETEELEKDLRGEDMEMEEGDNFANGGFSGAVSSRHSYLCEKVQRQEKRNQSTSSAAHEEDGALVDKFEAIGLRAKDKLMDSRPQAPPSGMVDEKAPKWYLVAQTNSKGVVAARIGMAEQWPDLLWADNNVVQMTRPMEVGDAIKVVSVEWAQTESGWATPGDWLITSNKRLNHQAVAKEVSECSQSPFSSALGLVLYVERDAGRKGDHHVKFATVAAPELPTIMRIQRRHMSGGMDYSIRSQTLLRMTLLMVNRPQAVWVSQHYVLPLNFPFKNGDEVLAYNANVIVRVEPETRIYSYPFDSTLFWEQLEFGEKVMACAVAAHRATINKELRRFTLVVEISQVFPVHEFQLNLTFRHQWRSVSEMLDMLEIWEEDTAISCRVDQSDQTKPCANGYVRRIDKQRIGDLYEVRVEVFLAFQDAKGQQNALDQFGYLRDDRLEAVELRPMVSTRALRERAELLAKNGCSLIAKDHGSPAGAILAILLGRKIPRDAAAEKVDEKLMGRGVLKLLKAGQRDSAEMMLDSVPRVIFQQAGPGTGKTFTAAAIMTAILKEDPKARILALAPLNIAVCKLVIEMEEALRIEGLAIPMLALFSGAGKMNYAEEVRRISPHLLAAAVDSEEFKEQLQRRDLRNVDRYITACVRNPRIAQEVTVAKILQEHAMRRICFCTLSFAEQTADLFAATTHLLVDEAGQAPYTQVLSLAFQLPSLKKLLVTGDRRQMSVHLPFGARENLGLDTIIQSLDASKDVDVTTLSVSYRSHPSIVRCVESAFYRPHGEVLTAGRAPGDRTLLTAQSSFKLPVSDSPILLIHQEDGAEPDALSRSTSNPSQSDTAMFVLWRLARAVPNDTVIRCICLYTAQMLELGQLVKEQGLNNVLVTTADATQAELSS